MLTSSPNPKYRFVVKYDNKEVIVDTYDKACEELLSNDLKGDGYFIYEFNNYFKGWTPYRYGASTEMLRPRNFKTKKR